MIVKIKLEPQDTKAFRTLKDIRYVSVDDNATIGNLKKQIERFVNIAAENQVIRTLKSSYSDFQSVQDLCDTRGSCIMLYAHNSDYYDYQEPHFICFLNIYSDESGLKQQEMEVQHSSAMSQTHASTSNCSISLETIIALAETESSHDDSDETASESDSSKISEDSLNLNEQNKRKLDIQENVDRKRPKATPVADKFSPTLCKYLDEFPSALTHNESSSSDESNNAVESKQSHQVVNEKERSIVTENVCKASIKEMEIPTTSPINTLKSLSNESQSTDGRTLKAYSSSIATAKFASADSSEKNLSATKSSEDNKAQSAIVTEKATLHNPKPDINSKITSTSNQDYKHPCYNINPEIRQYTICIYTDTGKIQHCEFEILLEWFSKKFNSFELSHKLQFVQPSPITHFDGKLWLACMNLETCDWVTTNLSQYTLQSLKIETLRNTDCYMYKVVIPKVVIESKNNLLDVFKLLEKQNPNLSTLSWCVEDRRILMADEEDYNTEAVSAFCNNELIKLWIDNKSKEFLDQVNQKLKYCFWEITFKVENN